MSHPLRASRWGIPISFLGLLVGLGAGGCLIGSNDFHPHNGTGGYAGGTGGAGGSISVCPATDITSLKLTWSLIDLNQDATTCAAVGATTLDLDALNVTTTVTTHDTFPCAAMQGVGSALAPGDYSVALRLRDAAGALASEAIAPRSYAVRQGCLTDLGAIPMQVSQSITFSWSLDKLATGAPLSCAQANVSTVALTIDGKTADWSCSAGQATSPALTPGAHIVSAAALDPQGTVLSETGTATVTIKTGQSTDLGDVIFDLN